MNITGLNHIAITAHNLEETISFYTDILGFRVDSRQVDEEQVVHCFLKRDDVLELELLWKGDLSQKASSGDAIDHIAMDVEDLSAAVSFLQKKGYAVEEKHLESFNTRLVTIKDPNGVAIALRKNIN